MSVSVRASVSQGIHRFGLHVYVYISTLPKNNMELHTIPEVPQHEPVGRSQVDFVPREIMQLIFFIKITPKLTWNPPQAQTEFKLHPETANMEFEQVITK